MRPACNAVLREVFEVTDENIERFNKESPMFEFDRHFGIDVRITLPNGSTITGQEKALSYKYLSFHTFTIEYHQNRHTKEPGEFFKIASQFYLSGYSDSSGVKFAEWHVIKLMDLIQWLRGWDSKQLESQTRPSGGSRASFLWIKYAMIPREFFIARWPSLPPINPIVTIKTKPKDTNYTMLLPFGGTGNEI